MAQQLPEPHPVEFSPEEVDLDQNMAELPEKVEHKKVDDRKGSSHKNYGMTKNHYFCTV